MKICNGLKLSIALITLALLQSSCDKSSSNDEKKEIKIEFGAEFKSSGLTSAQILLPVFNQMSPEDIENAEIEIGVFYGTNPNLPENDRLRKADENLNSMALYNQGNYIGSVELTGLKPNTTYYYRSYLVFDLEIFYGEIKEFRTGNIETLDSYYANAGITFNGRYNPNPSITEYGISFSKDVSLANASKSICANASADGKFSATLYQLQSDETYYYRAYVIVNGNIYNGDVQTFTSPVGTWDCYKCVVKEKKCQDFPEIVVGKQWDSNEGGTITFKTDFTGSWALDDRTTQFTWRFDTKERAVYATLTGQPEMKTTVQYTDGEFCMPVNDWACDSHITDVYWRYFKRR